MGSEHAGHRHEPLGLSGRALSSGLRSAEARCAAHGQKLTPARRRVLELLLSAGQPVKAYDLISAFGEDAGGPAKPPTVYRALEFLERVGLAHRIESLNAYMACGLGEPAHAAGFLICDCCGAAREIDPVPSPQVQAAADAAGYVACSGAAGEHAAAFLLCDCCGRTEEIAAPVDAALRDLAAAAGYTIQTVAIEAHGRCAACRDPAQD